LNIVRLVALTLVFLTAALSAASALLAQAVTVTGAVYVVRKADAGAGKLDHSGAVIWLKPLGEAKAGQSSSARPRFKIVQQHKRFDPHVLAVPVGSVVDFPNLDPFFHNVFSMFDGKRFDLGLYEAGTSQSVTFDRPGICYVFCNIHPEMNAVVVVTDSPYYAISDNIGAFSISNVPSGSYLVTVWHERGKLDPANEAPHEVSISRENASLPTIRLIDSGQLIAPHKNKYGHDYDRQKSSVPTYK
jgi:plastocyanin